MYESKGVVWGRVKYCTNVSCVSHLMAGKQGSLGKQDIYNHASAHIPTPPRTYPIPPPPQKVSNIHIHIHNYIHIYLAGSMPVTRSMRGEMVLGIDLHGTLGAGEESGNGNRRNRGRSSRGRRGRVAMTERRTNSRKPAQLSGREGAGGSEAETAAAAEAGPVFFWKPQEEPYGVLGQWYPAVMSAPLLAFAAAEAHQEESKVYTFNTCEQYMMAHKAHLFDPVGSGEQQQQQEVHILDMIMDEPDPRHQRALGRRVPNFDEQQWKAQRLAIVKAGNYLKFTQNEALKQLLLQTGDRELVEASPMDRVWGVGFGAKKAEENRHRWGLNLLGKALMEVRERIRREEEDEEEEGEEVGE